MKKISLIYGAISGLVIISSMILGLLFASGGEAMPMLEWLGYLIMLVAFSVIFVGIKRYRDLELGGVIRFPTAVILGLGITLVASVMYVAAWEVHLALTDYAFIHDYTRSIVEASAADGVSGTQMEILVQEMEQMREQYQKPLFRLSITFAEIFPVGFLITLISALILRRSDVLPASARNGA